MISLLTISVNFQSNFASNAEKLIHQCNNTFALSQRVVIRNLNFEQSASKILCANAAIYPSLLHELIRKTQSITLLRIFFEQTPSHNYHGEHLRGAPFYASFIRRTVPLYLIEEVYKKARESHVSSNELYTSYLHGCHRSMNISGATAALENAIEERIVSSAAFNIYIQLCGKVGDLSAASKAFEQADELRLRTPKIYASYLQVCKMVGANEEAAKVMWFNPYVNHAEVDRLVSKGEMDRAMVVFKEQILPTFPKKEEIDLARLSKGVALCYLRWAFLQSTGEKVVLLPLMEGKKAPNPEMKRLVFEWITTNYPRWGCSIFTKSPERLHFIPPR